MKWSIFRPVTWSESFKFWMTWWLLWVAGTWAILFLSSR